LIVVRDEREVRAFVVVERRVRPEARIDVEQRILAAHPIKLTP
jgi:hypothetical protein